MYRIRLEAVSSQKKQIEEEDTSGSERHSPPKQKGVGTFSGTTIIKWNGRVKFKNLNGFHILGVPLDHTHKFVGT